MLRSGTMANSIAPYHVVIGGKNEVLPSATGTATHNANAGRAIRTRMMPRSKISGPLDLCNVMITLSRESGLGSSGSWTRVAVASQPSNFPVTSTRAADFSREGPVPVKTSAEIVSVLYESNGQLPGSPRASMVVLTCAGALPTGYCRSPRSFSGYNRTAASVVSTPKFLSYSEVFG